VANVTSKGHKKHADIPRPKMGQYGRFELSLIGAPCNVIQDLVVGISEQLKDQNEICYVDADHHAEENSGYSNLGDKINFHRLDFNRSLNDYDLKILQQQSDIILVNGNHFKADRQIVICTEKKKDSLFRKLDRLTNVGLIVLDSDITEPHEFLIDHLSNYKKIPILQIDKLDQIVTWIQQEYNKQIPKIKSLVLAGGRSQRMGEDKADLNYHGLPQVYHAFKILEDLKVAPSISCRKDQSEQFINQFRRVYDTFEGLGPFGAILSAFRHDPSCAWLVIACDQPLLGSDHLQMLLSKRNASKIATCFHNPETGFPEPLITLWEPKAYPRLLSFLSMGYSCPRKVLINSEIEDIHLDDTEFMKNANTQEEREQLVQIIRKQGV